MSDTLILHIFNGYCFFRWVFECSAQLLAISAELLNCYNAKTAKQGSIQERIIEQTKNKINIINLMIIAHSNIANRRWNCTIEQAANLFIFEGERFK